MNDILTNVSASATLLAAGLTAFGSILLFFLKWLGDKFEHLAKSIHENNKTTQDWLMEHEEKDQDRHIDNLYRFEKIAVALAKLGANNGTHDESIRD